jgi:hypothetical protein
VAEHRAKVLAVSGGVVMGRPIAVESIAAFLEDDRPLLSGRVNTGGS